MGSGSYPSSELFKGVTLPSETPVWKSLPQSSSLSTLLVQINNVIQQGIPFQGSGTKLLNFKCPSNIPNIYGIHGQSFPISSPKLDGNISEVFTHLGPDSVWLESADLDMCERLLRSSTRALSHLDFLLAASYEQLRKLPPSPASTFMCRAFPSMATALVDSLSAQLRVLANFTIKRRVCFTTCQTASLCNGFSLCSFWRFFFIWRCY